MGRSLQMCLHVFVSGGLTPHVLYLPYLKQQERKVTIVQFMRQMHLNCFVVLYLHLLGGFMYHVEL